MHMCACVCVRVRACVRACRGLTAALALGLDQHAPHEVRGRVAIVVLLVSDGDVVTLDLHLDCIRSIQPEVIVGWDDDYLLPIERFEGFDQEICCKNKKIYNENI